MRWVALGLLAVGLPFDSLTLAQGKQDGVTLKYGGAKDASLPVSLDLTITLKISGTETLVNMVRSSAAFFNFEKIRVRATGLRRIAAVEKEAVRYRVEVDEARVDGTYDDEPYEFDFSKTAPPDDLEKDKLRQTCWWLGMAGREYTLGPSGAYRSNDENQDAWGEALDHAIVPSVRLPGTPVAQGVEWESKWRTERKQKDNDGRYELLQKAKIEKIASGVARVSFRTEGELIVPEGKQDKNVKKGENRYEASGWVEIEVDTGFVRASESKGKVRATATFHNEEGGPDHELEIVSTVESRVSVRDR